MTAERTKILILGGYGTFGGRLVRLLAGEGRLTLVIAGRSKRRAKDFCAGVASKAALLALEFDRDGDVEAQMKEIEPDIVVDASGPFQFYGSEPYRVIRAALALKIHYLDLADGSDFVTGIAQFDGQARARGVFILSGVSSFPVLTAAVVRRLSRGSMQSAAGLRRRLMPASVSTSFAPLRATLGNPSC
jgi:saccharopine dehydrogenase-like NADP-dependent oxidoreductase